MSSAGFEWGEYLGTMAPWENLDAPPPQNLELRFGGSSCGHEQCAGLSVGQHLRSKRDAQVRIENDPERVDGET